MFESRDPFIILPETEEADRLLDKADALLKRHRAPGPDTDIPVLTEQIEDDDIPVLTGAVLDAPAPPAGFVEQLIDLDATLNRRIDEWLSNELPQVLAEELEQARNRILNQIHARARATLLADISQEISELLDANDPRNR
ncbi:MAG TPA: hypothetical protein PK620_13515 [Denitromonas sp.]|uniref:hypothetical protein n=1 Tax=Denitromonas sp. TaxID=2734609 RepID=UPI001D41445B|nr:hypothetical protein [Rhodocyclaceae bacterium]MCP5223033.1 hypothetical protein [Zoogloeaceae bacterium]HQU88099.1 hypothetical protein [Denitromonas sp.]HQV15932.1 hypothetical protein [Denitromonas sp.]